MILNRKQFNIVHCPLQWSVNVSRSEVGRAHESRRTHDHFEGILARLDTRQIKGVLEAINGLYQGAKLKGRGYGRIRTIRAVIFLIAGKLNFSRFNPYVSQPT